MVTLAFFSALRRGISADRYMFVPEAVFRGKNMTGLMLSHFSHSGVGHLLFNMIAFYFFADDVYKHSGAYGLFFIYIAAAIGSDLLIYALRKNDARYRCLGASGSVSGIVFAAIVFDPTIQVVLFFVPIPIPGPIFAIGYIIVSLLLMKKSVGGVSHEAHIGGALAGLAGSALLNDGGLYPLWQRIMDFFS